MATTGADVVSPFQDYYVGQILLLNNKNNDDWPVATEYLRKPKEEVDDASHQNTSKQHSSGSPPPLAEVKLPEKLSAAANNPSHFEDYSLGQVLPLEVLSDHVGGLVPGSKLRVCVRRIVYPRTLSCPLLVEILDTESGDLVRTAFLKLFDRRFACQLREDWAIKPWDQEKEKAFIQYVREGDVDEFLRDEHHALDPPDEDEQQPDTNRDSDNDEDSNNEDSDESDDDDGDDEDDDGGWNDGESEALLADKLYNIYKSEVTAYNKLHEWQGSRLPRLIASVNLSLVVTGEEETRDTTTRSELFQIKGVLLDYIEGFPMSELQDKTPQSVWQDIIDEAVSCVHLLGTCGILNDDIRTGNFMIAPVKRAAQLGAQTGDGDEPGNQTISTQNPATSQSPEHDEYYKQLVRPQKVIMDGDYQYRVFMIDFGICRFEHQFASAHDFAIAKNIAYEPNYVGITMQRRLAELGFQLRYDSVQEIRFWRERAGPPPTGPDDKWPKWRKYLEPPLQSGRVITEMVDDGDDNDNDDDDGNMDLDPEPISDPSSKALVAAASSPSIKPTGHCGQRSGSLSTESTLVSGSRKVSGQSAQSAGSDETWVAEMDMDGDIAMEKEKDLVREEVTPEEARRRRAKANMLKALAAWFRNLFTRAAAATTTTAGTVQMVQGLLAKLRRVVGKGWSAVKQLFYRMLAKLSFRGT